MAFSCPWWRSAGGGILSSYLSIKRDLDYLAVAYGKIVFASAGGYSSTWGKNTIGQSGEEEIDDVDLGANADAEVEQTEDPITGEIKTKIKTKKVKTSGVYEKVTGDKFRPKAHLVAITTAGMDTLGMTQKGSYTYRTYGGLGKLPTVGETKSMAWGWAYGGKVLSGEGFSGKVIGYNISSNSEGGFDVTVELIGNNTSVSVSTISADAASPEFTSQGTTDAAGNESKITGIFSSFADCQKQAATGKAAGSGVTFNNGLTGCIIEVPEDYAKAKTGPQADTGKTQFKAYVTFKSVVDVMNKILKTFTTTEIDSSEAMVSWWDSQIQAGNPMEMLVPGKSTYGDKVFDTGGGTFSGDPNNLLISVDMLVKFGQPTVEEGSQADGTKRRLSIKSFFDNVFDLINDNTGQAYSLTLANSATKSDKKIYIVDFNKLPTVGATPVNTVRSANLSAKLDSDQASMFYIIKNAPRDNKQQGNNADVAPDTPADYSALLAAVGKSADEQNCAALKSENKNLIATKLSTAKGFGTAAPWDLSVTIDGTGGWQYGGVITYTAAGAAEKLVPGYKVGFAITNVTHNVTQGDWTTSLSTYCRIYK
jgi:hypothetical protein